MCCSLHSSLSMSAFHQPICNHGEIWLLHLNFSFWYLFTNTKNLEEKCNSFFIIRDIFFSFAALVSVENFPFFSGYEGILCIFILVNLLCDLHDFPFWLWNGWKHNALTDARVDWDGKIFRLMLGIKKWVNDVWRSTANAEAQKKSTVKGVFIRKLQRASQSVRKALFNCAKSFPSTMPSPLIYCRLFG